MFLLLSFEYLIAQDGKPNNQQTIQFIKEYFKETSIKGSASFKDGSNQLHTRNVSYDSLKIEFDSLTKSLNVYFELTEKGKIYTNEGPWNSKLLEKHQYKIDLSKIESINILLDYPLDKDKSTVLVSLVLTASTGNFIDSYVASKSDTFDEYNIQMKDLVIPANAEKVKTVSIPIKLYGTQDPNFDHAKYNEKIFKAFNHLRKLSGAPEPISFD